MQSSSTPSSSSPPTSPSASASLLTSLLNDFRYGSPPFLVRTLKYVHDDKLQSRNNANKVFDLNWTSVSHRSAHGRRHLNISVHPSNCVVSFSIARQLSAVTNTPSSTSPSRLASLQLSLQIRQVDGHTFSFAVRRTHLRVWLAHIHPDRSVRDDLPVNASFDFSSFLPLLTAPMARLSLVCHLSSFQDPSSSSNSQPNSFSPTPPSVSSPAAAAADALSNNPTGLVGAVIIWKKSNSHHGTAVASQTITVPLSLTSTVSYLDNSDLPKCRCVHLSAPGSAAVDPSSNISASMRLRIQGHVENSVFTAAIEKPRILVTVNYESGNPDVPWDGIVRHDFICPWCHRNCHRFRSLLVHLQVEHSHLKFSLQGMESGFKRIESGGAPFTVRLDVTPVQTIDGLSSAQQNQQFSMYKSSNGPHTNGIGARGGGAGNSGTAGDSEDFEEENFINPGSYPSLLQAAKRAHENAELQAGMNKVTLNTTTNAPNANANTDSDTGSTVIEADHHVPNFPTLIRENLCFCSNCGRRHDRSYDGNEDFCSEWCETTYVQDRQSQQHNHQLTSSKRPISAGGRERKINYKEAFGKLQLFHIVSVSEMKEEHFDEDDPDSEEEVDQSWRLDLNIERVRSLEDVSAKEKVLWILWNKFAYKNYPIPSLYGERYTRYTLELFVLDYRVQIQKLKLRTQLFGFLKALHIHGLIDSRAIISVMECLDGKKKRRDIAISARPELPLERRAGAAGAAGASSNGRRSRSGNSKRRSHVG